MERIDFHGGFFNIPAKPPEKKETKKSNKSRPSFFSLVDSKLSTEAPAESELNIENTEELEKTLDRVHELGDRLKNDPTLHTVGEYKKAVKHFLKIIVNRCYLVEEKTSSKNLLNQKKYTQIRIIDEKLERLAAGVMSSQREQVEILRRVDEIYGALVDLLQ
jgi:uncharacterized protein YaaR (DUF327 family)